MQANICLLCSGDAYPLGTLGLRTYFQCRDCGAQFSRKTKSPKRKAKERRAARKAKELTQIQPLE